MKKTILFDLDGTLIDSTESILDGFRTAFKQQNEIYPDDEKIKSFIGYPLEIMFSKLGVKDELVDEFVKAYKSRYKSTFLDATTLLPSAKEAVKEAYEFADLGVVTTKTSKYSVVLLEDLGILQYFSAVIGRDDVSNAKPHPEPILKALSVMKKSFEHSYMVGDTKLDAICATKAGINSVCVTCGYGKKNELEQHCKNIFKTPLEAVNFIKNL
ncbi:HAD family hydrolase [Campylobacter geochelonis]|uniref:phosphoglycolate phosphatase n=1 Tax=Campylobacter geochelonis TaxID=1780362 RepID=A0A128EFU7_9BACT|nr:HAD family hydrolase [Campylobacter geochelonis]QKF71970.1 HAD superfamily hydrolase, probable phosphatase [Campylobacter geochelonis]CZE47774.1 phosphoglycolate phosphatase [Campylobacter geochelonis]